MIITVSMTSFKMNFKHCAVISMFCILACGTSCIYVDEELGSNLIPTEQRYTTYIDEFPLEKIGMTPVSQLSGYSSNRVTVGAVRSEDDDVVTRSSAFSLIPAAEYDFGEGGEVVQFHFAIAKDTLSYIHENQRRILQDVNIYELSLPVEDSDGYIGSELEIGGLIADVATYDGGDSLSFDFRLDWANSFLRTLQEKVEDSVYDSVGAFTEKVFPGIYIDIDAPASPGGRINMFTLTSGVNLEYYYISGNLATLTVRGAKFDGKEAGDTTFVFMYGARDFSLTQEATDYYSGETITPQSALNLSSSTLDSKAASAAGDEIIVDGGGGLKPVISAREMRESFMAILQEKGFDPADVVINKASLVLPYDRNTSYEDLECYPALLSPTCRVYGTSTTDEDKEIVSYAGITDSSASSENQGNIDRSNAEYAPDISFHMQQILALDEYDENDPDIVRDYEEKDIWLLTLAVEQEQEEQEGTSEYYQNLQYSMYYNSLYNNYYGYGYGGYGYGYGGYYGGYGYNNYYDYYAMAAYYSSMQSSQQSSSTTVLDRDRYYKAVLRGPAMYDPESQVSLEEQRVPYMRITYSIRQK